MTNPMGLFFPIDKSISCHHDQIINIKKFRVKFPCGKRHVFCFCDRTVISPAKSLEDNLEEQSLPLRLTNRNANPNHIYLWNSNENRYDVIDKTTGKRVLAVEKSEFHFAGNEYSFEAGEIICDHLRQGKTMKQIQEIPGMPSESAFYFWRRNIPEFRRKSDEAIQDRAFHYHDKLLEIAQKENIYKDDVPGLKLQADIYKWAAEKADPERFGTKKQELQLTMPKVIVLDTGINNNDGPSLDELLGNVSPAIEAEFTTIEESNGHDSSTEPPHAR